MIYMKRLSESQKSSLNKLIHENKSMRQISRELKLSHTTVYYHTRKARGLQFKHPDFSVLKSAEIGELMGAFAGDGSYYLSKYGRGGNHFVKFYFESSDLLYINRIHGLLKKCGLNVFFCRVGKKRCTCLSVSSVDLISFIKIYLDWSGKKTYSVHLKGAPYQDHDFARGFLIGAMNTDGYITEKVLSFSSTSEGFARDVSNVLKKLEISHRTGVYRDKRPDRRLRHTIVITDKKRCYELVNLDEATRI
jgi:hypothetical protein